MESTLKVPLSFMAFSKIIPVNVSWIFLQTSCSGQCINELYHKSKEVGLSDAELKEQLILRKEYIDSVRRNLRGQLDNISVKEADGSITNLGEKYGNKKVHQADYP